MGNNEPAVDQSDFRIRDSYGLKCTCIVHDLYMHLRQLIFIKKSDCLGCVVLLCFVVCLTLLASFFLPSHLSLKHVHVHTCTCSSLSYTIYTYEFKTCVGETGSDEATGI